MTDLRASRAAAAGLEARLFGSRELFLAVCCATQLLGVALASAAPPPAAPASGPGGDRPRPRLIDVPGTPPGPRKSEGSSQPPRDGGHDRDAGRRGDVPIEKLIEVAEDIEPGWAKSLRERLETDREATVRAIRQSGARLVGLVMLKERNRGFYEMKVKELQAQIEARKIAQQYHEAHDSGREEDCDRALERMREICQRVVDLQLWQRASELNSLEALVKEQRESLERDAKPEGTRVLVDQLVKEMTSSVPALGLFEVIERRSADRPPLQPVVSESDIVANAPSNAPPTLPPPPPPPRQGSREARARDLPVERFIEVAEDISPTAAATLRRDLESDREGTVRTIRQGGPRYFGLVMLKDRDPELYQLKVSELKLHLGLRAVASDYHEAVRENRTAEARQATDLMAKTSAKIVQLQLQQRGREVASLAEMIDTERAALGRDSRPEITVERRDRMMDDLMHSPPAPALSDVLERRGHRGGREEIPSAADPIR